MGNCFKAFQISFFPTTNRIFFPDMLRQHKIVMCCLLFYNFLHVHFQTIMCIRQTSILKPNFITVLNIRWLKFEKDFWPLRFNLIFGYWEFVVFLFTVYATINQLCVTTKHFFKPIFVVNASVFWFISETSTQESCSWTLVNCIFNMVSSWISHPLWFFLQLMSLF